jgi:hypothetical protein
MARSVHKDDGSFRAIAWAAAAWQTTSRAHFSAYVCDRSLSRGREVSQRRRQSCAGVRFGHLLMASDLPEHDNGSRNVGLDPFHIQSKFGRRFLERKFRPGKVFVARDRDASSTTAGGGSGGTRKRDHHGDGHGDDDDGRCVLPEIEVLLDREARSVSSLPTEFQSKIFDGSLEPLELERFFNIEKMFFLGAIARIWPAFRSRLVANPRFLSVMAVELIIGFFSKTAAEMRQRGDSFWSEFDFYLSDIMLELVGDFALVWLLSPTLAVFQASPRTSSILSALSSQLERLPKFALQAGASFTPGQRLACLLLKGLQFGLVGFFASIVGHSLTKALVHLRKTLSPQAAQNNVKLAPVLANSISWGTFMALSSNLRYQAVSAIEARALEPLLVGSPALLFTAISFLLRFANTYAGGLHWIQWAKWSGVQ